MSTAHLYTDFGNPKSNEPKNSEEFSSAEIDEIKLEAFDQGFAAGWEEALKVDKQESAKELEAIRDILQDAEFSIHEARRGLLDNMRPLFSEITQKLLPEIAQQSLGLHIAEQLLQVSSAQLGETIEIETGVGMRQGIENALNAIQSPSATISENPNTHNLSALIRVGAHEREVDLSGIIDGIGDALSACIKNSELKVNDV